MLSDAEIISYLCSKPAPIKRALLCSIQPNNPSTTTFYSGIEGKLSFEQPVANILQKIDTLPVPMNIYLSYPPSEIELGMIWRAKIRNIYFAHSLNPLVIGQYKVTNDGCELTKSSPLTVKTLSDEQKQLIEASEPQLKIAMSNPIDKREMNQNVVESLKRGLAEIGSAPIVDNRPSYKTDEDFMRIVLSLVDRSWNSRDATLKPRDRVAGNNIGAIMVDANNRIIGWGLNYRGNNHTLHAETMMIQHYLRENNLDKLPEGIRIYTSLQCCHMCAGHIAELGKNIKVIYAQRDTFQNESASQRHINGCSEAPTTLPIRDVFSSLIGKQMVLDFLFETHPSPLVQEKFTRMPTRDLFSRAYRDLDLFSELKLAAHTRMNKYIEQNRDASVMVEKPSTTTQTSEEGYTQSTILEQGRRFLDGLRDIAPPSTPKRQGKMGYEPTLSMFKPKHIESDSENMITDDKNHSMEKNNPKT